jgi:hypothetical protein
MIENKELLVEELESKLDNIKHKHMGNPFVYGMETGLNFVYYDSSTGLVLPLMKFVMTLK